MPAGILHGRSCCEHFLNLELTQAKLLLLPHKYYFLDNKYCLSSFRRGKGGCIVSIFAFSVVSVRM